MWSFVVVGAMSSFVWQETAKMRSQKDRRMRPWISLPNWDGKLVLAALFTAGYFWLVYSLIGPDRGDLSETQKQIATIALAALGPQLGQIFGAIFRHTLSDERDAERSNEALKTAIETPSVVSPAGNLGDKVREGAEDGARAGVAEGMGDALGAGPEELPEYAR